MPARISNAPLSLHPVVTAQDKTDFIRLPHRLYQGHPGYWPAPDLLVRDDLDPKLSPFFTHGRAKYWLAKRGREIVGRVSAQIDEAAILAAKRRTGFFGFLDARDDAEAFKALIGMAEAHLRAEDCSHVWGPLSHSLWEIPGLLIENFIEPGMIMMPYSPPYASAHIEAAGYAKVKDLHAWIIEVGSIVGLRKPGKESRKYRVRNLNPQDYPGDIRRVVEIFNDAWSANWGFVPYTEVEIAHLTKTLRPIIDPDLVVIVEVDGAPAAMSVCLPNILEAGRDLDGRLLPFGWAKFLWRLQTNSVESCRILLMGLAREHHETLLGAAILRAMFTRLDQGMMKRKFKRAEMSWILEDNGPMIRVLKSIGGRDYKTYRVYEKTLS